MIIRIHAIPALLALVSSVFADVTYNVIGFPDAEGNSFAVEVNKKLYPLQTTKNTFPLWSAKVPGASTSSKYRYVQLAGKDKVVKKESFERSFTSKDSSTWNEFFGRKTTFTKLPSLPQVYDKILPKPSKAFDNTQIGTIHLTADPAALEDMFNSPLDKEAESIAAGFRFINADTQYSADKVKLKITGNGSRNYAKVSLGIKFDIAKGETFFDRPYLKLRAQATDPSMLREMIDIDIFNSLGVPTTQGSYVRVYLNGKPHGLFLMIEDIDAPFLSTNMHHGRITKKSELGSLFKAGNGATPLVYKGDRTANYNPNRYKNRVLGNNPKDEPMQQLIAFMKTLKDWNPSSKGGVQFWKQHLDLDRYLRMMSMDYLTGAWDSFWFKSKNYYIYYNPESKVWQVIPTDFDHTFSAGDRPGIEVPYKEFGQKLANGKRPEFPLVNKLIYENKDINKQFETTLLTITKKVFNNKALDARLDAYVKLLEEDVAWDFAIDRSKFPGKRNKWTVETFRKSVNGGPEVYPNPIKNWVSRRAKRVFDQLGK
ncbi:hypothetical protein BGW42_007335 [Actinomortierella wolfii]|nr:hypothetical protein BGW42_007335 [Actinomortierella wolfii]